MGYDISGDGTIFHLALSCVLPFISALVLIPILIQLDKKKHLSAIPNSRSSHIKTISNIGGVGIFISIAIGFLPNVFSSWTPEIYMLILAFIVVFLLGIKDDIFESGPYFKLFGQIIVAVLITEGAGLKVDNLYGVLGIYHVHPFISSLISILFIITVINATNFIDGIDGLAAMIGMVGFLVAGIILYVVNEPLYLTFAVLLITALLGFLRYNLSNEQKVFMGDTGSLTIGLALSVFILKIWGINNSYGFPHPPLWAVSIAALPLMDFIRVFLIRITNGRSPMRADRNHVHHVLVDHCSFSHVQAAMLLSLLSLVFVFVSFIISYSNFIYLIIFWFAAVFFVYIAILHQIQKLALQKAEINNLEKNIHKAVLKTSFRSFNQRNLHENDHQEKLAGTN